VVSEEDETAAAVNAIARRQNADWLSKQLGVDDKALPEGLRKKLLRLAGEVATEAGTFVSQSMARAATASLRFANAKQSLAAITTDDTAAMEDKIDGDLMQPLGEVLTHALQSTLGTAEDAVKKQSKAGTSINNAGQQPSLGDLDHLASAHASENEHREKEQVLHNRIALACAMPFPRAINLAVIDDISRSSFISYYESGEYGRAVRLACKVTRRYLRSMVRPSKFAERARNRSQQKESSSISHVTLGNMFGMQDHGTHPGSVAGAAAAGAASSSAYRVGGGRGTLGAAGAGLAAARGLRAAPLSSGTSEGRKRVVIFDVDDTALSSYHYMLQTQLQRLPQASPDWFMSASAPGLAPVYKLYRWIVDHTDIGVVFVSERPREALQATKEALVRAGFSKFHSIVLRPDEDDLDRKYLQARIRRGFYHGA